MTDSELEAVLFSLADVVDGDEPIDELSHALQCARQAELSDSAPELLVAALFHDVARSPYVSDNHRDVPHEVAGAAWLRPRFGERVAWIVGAHVAAKLYLVATEPGYGDLLSSESVRSAAFQGSAPTGQMIEHPWWPDALQLRRWDDAAKEPGAALPDPSQLLAVVFPLLTG